MDCSNEQKKFIKIIAKEQKLTKLTQLNNLFFTSYDVNHKDMSLTLSQMMCKHTFLLKLAAVYIYS